MIPKIIHYCWFGKSKLPEKIIKIIESWKEKLPDYEIIVWNEENFNVDNINFTKQAYEAKKYAFVSDYVRLYALYRYGGIYLDTDEEIIKNIDSFLNHNAVLGFDDGNCIISCFMAFKKEHKLIKELLDFYNEVDFIREDKSYELTPNTIWIQNILKNRYGLILNGYRQTLNGDIDVYPEEYFHAKSLITGKINVTSNTYGIHHHTLLWVSKKTLFIKFLRQNIIIPIIGKDNYVKITNRLKGEVV